MGWEWGGVPGGQGQGEQKDKLLLKKKILNKKIIIICVAFRCDNNVSKQRWRFN